ncbi:MAG: Uma2 family endonuclease [Acidobacteriota bacterium]
MSAVIETSHLVEPLFGVFDGQNLKLRQISVKEYDAMIKNGVFDEDDRIELLNGAIIEKMPKGTKHAAINDIIATRLIQKLGEIACVRNQNPIWLDEFSEPEPDIVLAEPPLESYYNRHPTPEDIFLILEISDSTLNYDRRAKSLAYSKAGIRQYLLLNVQEQTLEDYRHPGADGFQSKQTYRAGQEFNLVAFPEIAVQVSDFLPKINI